MKLPFSTSLLNIRSNSIHCPVLELNHSKLQVRNHNPQFQHTPRIWEHDFKCKNFNFWRGDISHLTLDSGSYSLWSFKALECPCTCLSILKFMPSWWTFLKFSDQMQFLHYWFSAICNAQATSIFYLFYRQLKRTWNGIFPSVEKMWSCKWRALTC